MKKVLFTSIISLSLIFVLIPFSSSHVYAYSSVALNSTHYRVEVSQTSNTSVTVSWAPSSTSNSRYIDLVHITGTVGSSQPVIYLALYGSDSVTFSITSGVSTNWTISIDNTYNVGSELYNESQINSSTTQILEEIQDLNAFLVTMNSNNLQTQAYISNINTQIQNIISNGLQVRLLNYDIMLTQVPVIAYYVGNGAVIQNTNDFIGGKTLIFDFPIYKGYEANNNAYLTTDTTDDPYIIIVAVNSAYQIFANATYTAVSGWSDVQTVETGYKRYSNTMQIDYLIIKNNKNGSTYTGARFYINYIANAITHLNNEQYIPIFYGKYSETPSEFLDLVGLKTLEETAGDQTAEDIDTSNSEFNTELENLESVQNDLTDDFEDNVEAIDTTLDITDLGTKFTTSANFVRTQFNNLTTGNPFGTLLLFTLTVGIALLIIGRTL